MDHSLSDTDLGALRSAELSVVGALAGASNHTLLVRLGAAEHFAVYKPRRGERPLWDFARGTLHLREVAAFEVSAFLGWDLVPPTVLRDGPLGVGSVQRFVMHDPRLHYFVLIGDDRMHPQLTRLATFDLLINNADRKGGHVLRVMDSDRIVGIDHGLAFHVQPKLRTVIWDLAGTPIHADLRADLHRLSDALSHDDPVLTCLDELLDPTERAALHRRAELLATTAALPDVSPDRRPYPWPPL